MNINFPEYLFFSFLNFYSIHKTISTKLKPKKNILLNDWFPIRYNIQASGYRTALSVDTILLSIYKWLYISNSKLTKSGELSTVHLTLLAYYKWLRCVCACICECYTKSNVKWNEIVAVVHINIIFIQS